tara:strand:+ start:172 stop:405 length:234 start_codon:yes stop_codon:yes gene_type:complete
MTNTEIPEKVFHRFFELSCQLEPENLYMDGEATPAQVRSRKSAITKEWRTLEQAIGRKVKDGDIWDIYWQKRKNNNA